MEDSSDAIFVGSAPPLTPTKLALLDNPLRTSAPSAVVVLGYDVERIRSAGDEGARYLSSLKLLDRRGLRRAGRRERSRRP